MNNIKYKEVNGTFFHEETDNKICEILVNAQATRQRLKFYFGDTATGKSWNEENDTIGTVGRSTGTIKIPLLIKTSRSYGGGAILDHCIVKIKDAKTGAVLYQHENYSGPKVEIIPSDMPEYKYNTIVNGELFGRHKTERSAKRTQSILS
jgi:hypothetical protein